MIKTPQGFLTETVEDIHLIIKQAIEKLDEE